MKTTLLMVGKTADTATDALVTKYTERIKHYTPFETIQIPDLKNTKNLRETDIKEKEATLILQHLSPDDYVVLLDDKGWQPTSLQLAEWLSKHQSSGRKHLTLIIGGPYGFAPSIYQRAQEKLSLSRLTFSHQMVRIIATEQLYRACTILKGEPYHHE